MNAKNIKRLKPQLIDGDTHLSTKVFNDRINRQELSRNHKGLNSPPEPLIDEEILIQGFATILNQSKNDIIIQHPLCPMQIILNKMVGARLGYLISCGDYIQQSLDMIHSYIAPSDSVLDIGAGLGLTTTLAAIKSENAITAVEPNKELHALF
ncbi:MAG: hypothetical protein ACI9TY_001346 [Alphaproteobacteria bacterium]